MALPHVDASKLRRVLWWEHALRFGFGGAITVAASVIAKRYGDAIGGLVLAFPAIMPASLTLVRRLDGRESAVDDARGGRIGAVALASFAAVVALTATRLAAVWVLAIAALAWIVVAVAGWLIVYGRS